MQETNDCTVKALSLTCRLTYKEAHKLLQLAGRKHGRGLANSAYFPVIESLGFTLENKLVRQKNGSKYTPKTIGQVCKSGYYLAHCRGHVLAVINGEVLDWTENRQHHIQSITKVVRKRST